MHLHFQEILSTTPRLVIASMKTFFISRKLDIFPVQLIKKELYSHFQHDLPFQLHSWRSVIQCFFLYSGFHRLVHSLFNICLMSYGVKLITFIVIATKLIMIKQYAFPVRSSSINQQNQKRLKFLSFSCDTSNNKCKGPINEFIFVYNRKVHCPVCNVLVILAILLHYVYSKSNLDSMQLPKSVHLDQ